MQHPTLLLCMDINVALVAVFARIIAMVFFGCHLFIFSYFFLLLPLLRRILFLLLLWSTWLDSLQTYSLGIVFVHKPYTLILAWTTSFALANGSLDPPYTQGVHLDSSRRYIALCPYFLTMWCTPSCFGPIFSWISSTGSTCPLFTYCRCCNTIQNFGLHTNFGAYFDLACYRF